MLCDIVKNIYRSYKSYQLKVIDNNLDVFDKFKKISLTF